MGPSEWPVSDELTVAEVIVDLLARAGVREVFGVAGSTIMPLLDAIDSDPRVRFVGARHEQSAADMASGYARASGKLGVITTHVGPGVTSCLTSMVAASREGVPLLLITGNEESRTLLREPYHDWDLLRAMGTITHASHRIAAPADVPHALRRAVGQATRETTQPVHIDLPEDVALATVSASDVEGWLPDCLPVLESASAGRVPLSRPAPSVADVHRAAELVANARTPLLLLGEARQWCQNPDAVVDLCEALALPYATTHGARGGVGQSLLCVGTVGRFGSQEANALMADADLVLALGAELSDIDTVGWSVLDATRCLLVAAHPDPRKVDLRMAPTLGVVADVEEFLGALVPAVAERTLRATRAWRSRAADTGRASGSLTGHSSDGNGSLDELLVTHLLEATPDSWTVTVDPGFGPLSLSGRARLGHSAFLYPFGFGYMGFAVPNAIGAVFSGAVPGAVAVIGDGSFFMSMSSLESVASLQVPVVVAVLDDGGFGSQRQKQREAYGRNAGVNYDNPDIARIGAALGLESTWVRSAADVEQLCASLPGRKRGALAVVERARYQEAKWYEGTLRRRDTTSTTDTPTG